ncbi:MAG TPA: hypothetical protein DCE14_01800 [Kosmotogaceae bacterium]|nr:MAG: Uncharacterized protein XE05_0249 [Thermotogales bacterium 46_20]HAA85068.1 hypothetical protein [Kosmotogaceae bacterium]
MFIIVLLIINLGLTGYLLYKTVLENPRSRSGEQRSYTSEPHGRVKPETEANFLKAAENALNSGRIHESELLLKSCLFHYPTSSKALERFLNLMIIRVDKSSDFDEKLYYLSQAENSILRFSEAAGPRVVSKAAEDFERINRKKEELLRERENTRYEQNREMILRFEELAVKLESAEEESETRVILSEACSIEEALNEKTADEELRERYAKARERIDKLASTKGEEIRNRRLAEYNSSVLDRLNNLLDDFNKNEKVYEKSAGDFAKVVRETIAGINPYYLSTEVLTYFNYVYGFVFSLVEDDVKYEITKVMTDTPKEVIE